ncbi:MAG TPA: hypothetical protein VMV41_06885 [Cellulomonadaceae bacterium]|nr:hypothetical protein [Cellulomonadaceae bacterium]
MTEAFADPNRSELPRGERRADSVASAAEFVCNLDDGEQTDGEPTSHLEPGGEPWFDYPLSPLTIARTVRELDAATRLGAHTTFFRLVDDAGLARFVDAMARRTGGTVVAPEADDLGAAVIGSYLDAHRGRDGIGEGFGATSWPA